MLIDDGLIELTVDYITDKGEIHTTVKSGGRVSNRKGVNVPGVHLTLPFLSEADKQDLLFGIETGFDFVAASFVRTAEDVGEMRRFLEEHGGRRIKIISKIENAEGVENIDEILRVSDGVMVARGDMGVEIPLEDVPIHQKSLIKKAYMAGKHVITATQMLESMSNNPRPTRAEANDVANAIYDGTSAIMLSGESAAGKYPVEAVATMATIARRTEQDIDYRRRFYSHDYHPDDVTNAISHGHLYHGIRSECGGDHQCDPVGSDGPDVQPVPSGCADHRLHHFQGSVPSAQPGLGCDSHHHADEVQHR